MNVLITGGNGAIGRHICNYFSQKGCYVIALGIEDECYCNCNEYIKCDMSSSEISTIFSLLRVDSIDAILHLAADVRHEYKAEIVANNCVGVQRLLQLCVDNKIPTFIQMSSLPVIGVPKEHPITENHPLKPPTVYHITKCMSEMLADFANYTYGVRTVSFRVCSPIGIGINNKMIFSSFVRRSVNNEDLHLVGKGSRKQSYIHVKDIAQAFYRAVLSNSQGIYNLASSNLISNLELAKKCIANTNSKSKIVFEDKLDIEEGNIWDVDISKLVADTGFEPTISIDDAIAEMTDYFRNNKMG